MRVWTDDAVSTDAAKLVTAGRVSGVGGESASSGMEAPTPSRNRPLIPQTCLYEGQ